MVARCSNPQCTVPFRYLGSGRLFAVATSGKLHAAAVRWHWLCADCARDLTVLPDDAGGIVVAQQKASVRPSMPAA